MSYTVTIFIFLGWELPLQEKVESACTLKSMPILGDILKILAT